MKKEHKVNNKQDFLLNKKGQPTFTWKELFQRRKEKQIIVMHISCQGDPKSLFTTVEKLPFY